jgi:hypothetical protein
VKASGFRREFRSTFRWQLIPLAFAVIVLPLWFGVSGVAGSAFRSNFDIYQQFMNSPIDVALPIFAVLLGCLPTYWNVRHRFASNTRTRMPVRRYVLLRIATSTVIPFCTLFLWSFISFIVAYYVWPDLGNPGVQPSVYEMTSGQAILDSYGSVSYSEFLQYGPLVYGLLYSVWLGLGGALYAAIGVLALIYLRASTFALTIPLIIYVGETIIATLLGNPHGALLFSLLPFGVTQTDPLDAAMPTLILAALASIASLRLLATIDRGHLT